MSHALEARHNLLEQYLVFLREYGIEICALRFEKTRGAIALEFRHNTSATQAFFQMIAEFVTKFSIEPYSLRCGERMRTASHQVTSPSFD